MSESATAGRANQKRRTRKDLLEAAARLMRRGLKPGLEEVAEEALVSRATAYRYFPSVEALLREAALDIATPHPAELFRGVGSVDPVTRLGLVDAALDEMTQANEGPLRMMLAHSMERAVRGEGDADMPLRQNRRSPLIEAALEPALDQLDPRALENLGRALALVIGTEAMIVLKDVLQLDDAEGRAVRRWAIAAFVAAAARA